MSTINDWVKYINVVHELALVEGDLREVAINGNQRASAFALRELDVRFGVLLG